MTDENKMIEFEGKHVKLERWGLAITGDIEWDEFSALGKKLMTVHDGMQFALGDWVIYGQARWGHKYDEALERTQYPYGTLRNFVWVCRRFPQDIREQLSHQYDKQFCYTRLFVLSRLPSDAALEMLELGSEKKWSVLDLIREIDIRYPHKLLPRKLDTENESEWLHIRSYPHYGEMKGPGFFLWFGASELPLLQQIFPKHQGTILMQKRLAQVVDAKAK